MHALVWNMGASPMRCLGSCARLNRPTSERSEMCHMVRRPETDTQQNEIVIPGLYERLVFSETLNNLNGDNFIHFSFVQFS